MRVKCFPPVANQHSRVLILGTAPGDKSLEHGQYYAHGGNRFWPMMSSILGERLPEDYEDRKQMLLDHGIALWDVLAECDRDGSGDAAITNEAANDFNAFLTKHPAICAIIFAGKNPDTFFKKHVKLKEPIAKFRAVSTSPANNRNYSVEELDAIWRALILKLVAGKTPI